MLNVIEYAETDLSYKDKVQIVKIYEKEILSFLQEGLKSKKISELINRLTVHL